MILECKIIEYNITQLELKLINQIQWESECPVTKGLTLMLKVRWLGSSQTAEVSRKGNGASGDL